MSYYKPKPSQLKASSPLVVEGSLDDDREVPADATDTISCVRWSPASNHLAAASWDGKLRVYDVAADLSAKGVAAITTGAPVLTCDWTQVS